MANKTLPPRNTIGVFTFLMITGSMIISTRTYPTFAEAGFSLVFYIVVGALFFFIPSALVSGELATGWLKKGGGVYTWVSEAFGKRWGFLAIWLQWMMSTFAQVTIIYFIAGSLAYLINPALNDSALFRFLVVVIVYWGVTFLNFRGTVMTGRIGTVGFLGGVVGPGIFIVVLGVMYIAQGNPMQIDISWSSLIPDMRNMGSMVLLVGFLMALAGIEASATHVNEVRNVRAKYPMVILILVALSIFINAAGSLSVAAVVPQSQISMSAGVMEAFHVFLGKFGMLRLMPIMAILLVLGAIAQSSGWITGPAKGLLLTARDGMIPPRFQKVNKYGVPVNLFVVQAILVTAWAALLTFGGFGGANISFWLSIAITMALYLTMYILLFLAGIRLRYTQPDVERPYRVPGGKAGMWIIGGMGLATSVFALVISFIPPSTLQVSHLFAYKTILAVLYIALVGAAFLIYHFRKSEWGPRKQGDQSKELS